MKYFKLVFLFSLMTFTPFVFSNDENTTIATALTFRGEVSVLPPHSLKAHQLKKGEALKKDSSIYVKGKGFAVIKFINNSKMTLGPNSKTVVEMDLKDKTSLVGLVVGKIRAKVKSDKKGNTRFLIKTRSATMGVRGTDFQVAFEPQSKRTSLLTYEGRVDIAKPKPQDMQKIGSAGAEQKVSSIKEILKKEAEPVKKGDFTNVASNSKKVIKPVKINPTQFALLKRDDTLGAVKKSLTKKEKAEIKEEAKKLTEEFKQEMVQKGEEPAINQLGLVDADTGLYVPPQDNGAKTVGEIDDNGSYVPPKGVEIDPKKGLVVTDEASEEVVKMVEKAQEQVEQQVPQKPYDPAYNRYFVE
jgi:hypothetical protein